MEQEISYEENILLKAIELAKVGLPNTWHLLPAETQQLEVQRAIPEAKKAMEWCRDTAYAIIGPQLSKTIIDAQLVHMGIIPTDSLKPKTGPEGI